MAGNLLKLLSMAKYERLSRRIFPDARCVEIFDGDGNSLWRLYPGADTSQTWRGLGDDKPIGEWAGCGVDFERRQVTEELCQYRAPLILRTSGRIGWLVIWFSAVPTVPMSAALGVLRQAFADVAAFLQEELELQSECNQLAIELTERYEELNLVYSTQEQVEYFEQGQEALVRLVHNCADYLNVGLATLICRDRNLVISNNITSDMRSEFDEILQLLSTSVYNRVESQMCSVVLNECDDAERRRLFGGRSENVLTNPVVDDHGTVIGIIAVVARRDLRSFSNGDRNLLDVIAKKASRIIHTHHDSLTGLMNRSGFESSLVTALANSRTKNTEHCLLHIDIDQLHVVNDLLGYQEGDGLIRRVAKALRGILRESDFLARHGGDEFGVLLLNCDIGRGQAIADKIRGAVRELTVVSASRQLNVTASVGITMLSNETDGIVGAMVAAEVACKAAQESGRDRVEVFAEDNTTLVKRSEEVEWVGRVQQALREDQFILFCQPVMPLEANSRSTHYEILIRLHDNGEILAPMLFLPAAERYQLMPLVDRWVVRNTLRQLGAIWSTICASRPVFCINLSGQSLTNAGFLAFVAEELEASGVTPECVCFEVTETAAISNVDEATTFMKELQEIGCRFSLDDFGAGLSSFGYLKTLPVNYLKIDGSIVREIATDRVSLSMVSAICQIARTMGLETIAECVGDDATVEILREIGVDFGQGYHLGMPVPLGEVTKRLYGEAAVSA